MKVFELFRIAFRSLQANKLRSFLTMLGMIIGVAAVIVMVSIGQGASAQVAQNIQSLGSNLIFIQGGQAVTGGVAQGLGSSVSLKMKDVDALSKLDSVQGVVPINQRSVQIVYEGKNTATQTIGTTPSFVDVRNWPVQSGRFFTDDEETSGAKVCTLGTTTVANLFGDPNADVIGKIVKINGIPFRVIGVMQSKGSTGFNDQDDVSYIPISTFEHRFLSGRDRDNIRTIYAQAKSPDLTNQAIDDITNALRRSHKLNGSQPNDFQVRNQADILASAQSTTQTLTYLLGGVAAISLLVGGIGIMNIMLVSVTERTREIGIRKAIGAKERDLLYQFLIESVALALFGGAIGIALGYLGSGNIGKMMQTQTQVSLNTVLLSFLFSAAIGVIFGVVPARKASKLDPIEALRYE